MVPLPQISYSSTISSTLLLEFSSVQSLSRVWLFATPRITARQASLSITNSQSSFRLTSIESVMPSSHLILCRPLLLLPLIPPSIRVFSNESTLRIRWPKYWSFSFSIIPSKEIPGLISFRMDWLDLFAVQGTLKSLLQHHSSKASILWGSAFFTIQLSHPCMTTGSWPSPYSQSHTFFQCSLISLTINLHLLSQIFNLTCYIWYTSSVSSTLLSYALRYVPNNWEKTIMVERKPLVWQWANNSSLHTNKLYDVFYYYVRCIAIYRLL